MQADESQFTAIGFVVSWQLRDDCAEVLSYRRLVNDQCLSDLASLLSLRGERDNIALPLC